MIQTPDQHVLQLFLKKTQFNFIKKSRFFGDFGDNHSIRSIQALLSVSITTRKRVFNDSKQ
ncbi:hypothetical protein Hanom_Chr01g00030121 [Helianthus anomalus]